MPVAAEPAVSATGKQGAILNVLDDPEYHPRGTAGIARGLSAVDEVIEPLDFVRVPAGNLSSIPSHVVVVTDGHGLATLVEHAFHFEV